MSTSRRLLLSLAFLAAPLLGDPIVTTYTDKSAFLFALSTAQGTVTEVEPAFEPGVNLPGLTIVTVSGLNGYSGPSYGHVADGAWQDCIGNCSLPSGEYSHSTTTWEFSQPIYAFGAYFDFSQQPWGASFEVYPFFTNGDRAILDMPDDSTYVPLQNTFWGFVSNVPITEVFFGGGRNPARGYVTGQLYSMTDLYVRTDPADSVAPEPATWSLLGLAALCAVVVKRRISLRLF